MNVSTIRSEIKSILDSAQESEDSDNNHKEELNKYMKEELEWLGKAEAALCSMGYFRCESENCKCAGYHKIEGSNEK